MAESADVCIIGAGAAGAMIAANLAESGVRVVVLEAGPRWTPEKDFENGDGRHLLFRSATRNSGNAAFGMMQSTGLGGGTINYRGASFRMRPEDFIVEGVEGARWPFTYQELEPYYERAEREIGISGAADDPWLPPRAPYPMEPLATNCNAEALKVGFAALGMRVRSTPYAVNSTPHDGRAACRYCGFCISGCPIDARNGTHVTHVPRAERAGAKFLTECFASRIATGPDGLVTGVEYFDDSGVEHFQRAATVVVSAFTMETPRILLNSNSPQHPDGLANSSGTVGRYIQGHTSRAVWGRFPQRIDRHRGLGGVSTRDFNTLDSSTGLRGGFTILASVGGGNSPLTLAQSRPAMWGEELKRFVDEGFLHVASTSVMGTETPDAENRVEIDARRKDRFGIPAVKVVHNWVNEGDLKVSDYGVERAKEVFDAAGAFDVYEAGQRTTHTIGSCRMGSDPKNSVVDADCRSHDVPNLWICDASIMPTGGCVNPTMTIQAVALKCADAMLESANSGVQR